MRSIKRRVPRREIQSKLHQARYLTASSAAHAESAVEIAWLRGRSRARPGRTGAHGQTRDLPACVTCVVSPVLEMTLGKKEALGSKVTCLRSNTRQVTEQESHRGLLGPQTHTLFSRAAFSNKCSPEYWLLEGHHKKVLRSNVSGKS